MMMRGGGGGKGEGRVDRGRKNGGQEDGHIFFSKPPEVSRAWDGGTYHGCVCAWMMGM